MEGKVLFPRGLVALAAFGFSYGSAHAEVSQAEFEALKKDLDAVRSELRSSVAAKKEPIKGGVDKALDNKFGPNAAAITKSGKLQISGLAQIWYYQIDNDNEGLFEDDIVNGVNDTNEASDNDSFRIRRAEVKFNFDVHENVTGVIMIDFARENVSFPAFSANTGVRKTGVNANVANVQTGAGGVPRILQDAYVNYHGAVPHHDFQVGQFKAPFGDENLRSAAQLDFVERALITQPADFRDIGAQIHGTWWDDRFQYWGGVFNSPGNFWGAGSGGQAQNRSDDNDAKDVALRLLVRPLWSNSKKSDCDCEGTDWGNLEFTASAQFGTHGESGNPGIGGAVNGLDRRETWAARYGASAYYAPAGPVKGWWLRGEYVYYRDRNQPGGVVDLTDVNAAGVPGTQGAPNAFNWSGWFFATGYHFGQGKLFENCSGAGSWAKNLEIAFRYEAIENVHVADLVNPETRTDVFKTQIYTAGLNYYIKGHNAKIQANYNVVIDPEYSTEARRFNNDLDNNSFVVNFQVGF